jgi:hypothetical protein
LSGGTDKCGPFAFVCANLHLSGGTDTASSRIQIQPQAFIYLFFDVTRISENAVKLENTYLFHEVIK